MHIGSYKSVETHSDGVGAGLSSIEGGWVGAAVAAAMDWGDILLEEHPELVGALGRIDHRGESEMERTFLPLGLDRVSGADFFVWDTSEMSDGNYRRLMEWVYWHGWDVEEESRTRLRAEPGFRLCRAWVPKREEVEVVEEEITEETRRMLEQEREEELWQRERAERRFKKGSGSGGARVVARAVVAAPGPVKSKVVATKVIEELSAPGTTVAVKVVEELSAPGSDVGRRNGCPVARFCKEGRACPTAGCRYVHGDTIPRIDEPCKFGAACGSGDAAKRATCLRMHPGETWTADLVVRRG
jgi:hypothetical protein